jgi:1-acyl-sn-glycerol-3-phosphate acyltransferase
MKHPAHSTCRAAVRAVVLVAWLLLILPFVVVFWALRLQTLRGTMARLFVAGALHVLGMRVTTIGAPSDLRPLMVVSNHTSYLDVFLIGAQLTVSFTPKREVRNWPFIGWLCVLADCVFVERRPAHMEAARAEMAKRIHAGRVLCLFPEGTTSNGKELKPFKSGFLSLAEQFELPVQPASIAYTHIGHSIITDDMREMAAWVGDATFFDHFWNVLGMPGIRATIRWHAPLQLSDFTDRKALTKAAETLVTAGVMADLTNPT